MEPRARLGSGRLVKVVLVVVLLVAALVGTYQFSSRLGTTSFPFGLSSTSSTMQTGTMYSSTQTSSTSVTDVSTSQESSSTRTSSISVTNVSTSQESSSASKTISSETASSTQSTSVTSSTSVRTTGTSGGNASLSCFAGTPTYVSTSTFEVNGTTAARVQYVNSMGGIIVGYMLPPIQPTVLPGERISYSLTFAANSSYTGVYIAGTLRGNDSISGFAGILGSEYYDQYASGKGNAINLGFLVPESSSSPYTVGVINSYTAAQVISVYVYMFTCGNSWLAAAYAR